MSTKQALTKASGPPADLDEIDELLGRAAVEFFEQRAAGNAMPTVEDYAKKYPKIADHIRPSRHVRALQ